MFSNRRGRQFNGCTASVIVYQLTCNLLLLNLVPATFPDEITYRDLSTYALPFNLVAFVIAAIMEVSELLRKLTTNQ